MNCLGNTCFFSLHLILWVSFPKFLNCGIQYWRYSLISIYYHMAYFYINYFVDLLFFSGWCIVEWNGPKFLSLLLSWHKVSLLKLILDFFYLIIITTIYFFEVQLVAGAHLFVTVLPGTKQIPTMKDYYFQLNQDISEWFNNCYLKKKQTCIKST